MSVLLGLGACAISSICFGSMFVAVRNFESGDGIFAQWIICVGIFLVGMIVNAVQSFPPFQPLAMLGGFLWAIGNVTALPIIKTIGLGMGILIWGTTNCAIGWASGRFGLFGIHADIPKNLILNYCGLLLVLFGGILFAFVKPSVKPHCKISDSLSESNEQSSLMNLPPNYQSPLPSITQSAIVPPQNNNSDINSKKSGLKNRIIAVIVAGFAGLCYGTTFVPVIYIQDHQKDFVNAPDKAIKYTFSHFSGIFLTSSFILIIYIVFKQNKPFVNGKIILPSLFAGLLWAVAQIAWFFANDVLSQTITFPINSMLPGVCGSLWSVFYFKEIEGAKNFLLLLIAIVITLVGAIFVGVSK